MTIEDDLKVVAWQNGVSKIALDLMLIKVRNHNRSLAKRLEAKRTEKMRIDGWGADIIAELRK